VNKPIFTFCFLYFFSFGLYAGENMTNASSKASTYGAQSYGKETVEEIRANGFVKLDGTTVRDLHVNGCLKAEGAKIGAMQVNGQVAISHSVVSKKSLICGSLLVNTVKFDDLSISSERVVLNNCIVSSVNVLKVGGYTHSQVIELRGKTFIQGSIVFEAGNGEVIVDPDSEFTGKIIGGTLRK
jgi:hypothetical protein